MKLESHAFEYKGEIEDDFPIIIKEFEGRKVLDTTAIARYIIDKIEEESQKEKFIDLCKLSEEGNESAHNIMNILDEIRNRDGIGYNDYSDLWDAISDIPVEEDND